MEMDSPTYIKMLYEEMIESGKMYKEPVGDGGGRNRRRNQWDHALKFIKYHLHRW